MQAVHELLMHAAAPLHNQALQNTGEPLLMLPAPRPPVSWHYLDRLFRVCWLAATGDAGNKVLWRQKQARVAPGSVLPKFV